MNVSKAGLNVSKAGAGAGARARARAAKNQLILIWQRGYHNPESGSPRARLVLYTLGLLTSVIFSNVGNHTVVTYGMGGQHVCSATVTSDKNAVCDMIVKTYLASLSSQLLTGSFLSFFFFFGIL